MRAQAQAGTPGLPDMKVSVRQVFGIDFPNPVGMAAGFELYPSKGLLIGARYNLSFAKTYKEQESNPGLPMPAFIPPPGTNGKNNVVQVFAGYRF